jgi:hypothetical protein
MEDDNDVQDIFELRSKIVGLLNWAKEAGKSGLDSLHALDDRAKADEKAKVAPYSTLQSVMKTGRISVRNQKALANSYGFSIDWREWRDPRATRTTVPERRGDSARVFLARFHAHKASGSRPTIDAGPTRIKVDRRFAEFAFGVSGSFEPSTKISSIPLILSLSFDRRGWPVFHDLTVRLIEVDVQLKHKRAPDSIEALPLTCRDEAEGNFIGTVDGLSPYWIIRVKDDVGLAGTRRRNNGQDCICHNFQIGDELVAVMTARVSNCFASTSGLPFDNLSEDKNRFVEHLCKLDALGGAEVTLGEQILKVIEVA